MCDPSYQIILFSLVYFCCNLGPRFVLNLVRIFEGSFGGPTLYENPHYQSPNEVLLFLLTPPDYTYRFAHSFLLSFFRSSFLVIFFPFLTSQSSLPPFAVKCEVRLLYDEHYTQLQKGCSIHLHKYLMRYKISNEIQSAKHHLFSSNISESSILD